MPEIVRSTRQVEDLMRGIVLQTLNLDPAANHRRVIFPWGSNLAAGVGSAPKLPRGENVCCIYALPTDEYYNKARHRRYIDYGGRDLTAADERTEVYNFNFANYGPDAFENARDIRDGLSRNDIRDIMFREKFFLVPDLAAIRRVPELKDGEWWNRADFSATFYEYVRREFPVNAIEKVSVTAIGSDGEKAQVSVTKPKRRK